MGDSELGQALGMVTAELLENAVAYSVEGTDSVSLSVVVDPDEARVRVTNPADDAATGVVARRIERIGSFDNPAEAYAVFLQESFERGDGQGSLGLPRIAYEGECRLALEKTPNGLVTVMARRSLSGPAG